MRYLVLCLGLALWLQSCPNATCHLLEKEYPTQRGVGKKLIKIVVSDGIQPCQDFKVLVNNQYFAATNEQGVAILVIPQQIFKATINISVSKEELNIKQSFRFTEASFDDCEQEVVIKNNFINERFKVKTDSADQFFSSIETEIKYMDQNLEQIYSRLKEYLKQHPGHVATEYLESIHGYQEVIKTLKSNVQTIRKRLNDMKNDPSQKVPPKYIIDLKHAEERRMEIQNLVHRIQDVTADYSINTRERKLNAVEKEIPVFFQSGEFTIPQLDEENKQILLDLPRVINAYFEQQKMDLQDPDLKFFVRVVGFCDGAPVSENLNQKIQPLCVRASYGPNIFNPAQDGNNCLSWLRAQSIYNYLKGNFPPGVLEKSIGHGSEKAAPNIPDASKRRVVISYLASKPKLVIPPAQIPEVVFPER